MLVWKFINTNLIIFWVNFPFNHFCECNTICIKVWTYNFENNSYESSSYQSREKISYLHPLRIPNVNGKQLHP